MLQPKERTDRVARHGRKAKSRASAAFVGPQGLLQGGGFRSSAG